jgi:hypothetical protein
MPELEALERNLEIALRKFEDARWMADSRCSDYEGKAYTAWERLEVARRASGGAVR